MNGLILESQERSHHHPPLGAKQEEQHMTPQEHHEFMIGWDAYQFGHSDINVCTSMLQRRGWLSARAAEEVVFMEDARIEAANEVARATSRQAVHA